MRVWLISELLLLLVVANGTPVLVALLLGQHFNRPLDAGRLFFDLRPWLGESKTIRGVLSAIIASTLCAPLAGLSYIHGAFFGGLAMGGDLLSSFIKRRLDFPSGYSRPGLDQLPETLLPLLLLQPAHGATLYEMIVIATAFIAIDLLLSRALRACQAACRR
jgi:CDP-2,3-bis-(O-geranylgeranyl)-sn-glycerol synthase